MPRKGSVPKRDVLPDPIHTASTRSRSHFRPPEKRDTSWCRQSLTPAPAPALRPQAGNSP